MDDQLGDRELDLEGRLRRIDSQMRALVAKRVRLESELRGIGKLRQIQEKEEFATGE